jgi:hypothetical protein
LVSIIPIRLTVNGESTSLGELNNSTQAAAIGWTRMPKPTLDGNLPVKSDVIEPKLEVADHGVVMESARFRNLLKTLGFKVTIWWKPRTVTDKRTGKTRQSDKFSVDRVEITIDGQTLGGSPRRRPSR